MNQMLKIRNLGLKLPSVVEYECFEAGDKTRIEVNNNYRWCLRKSGRKGGGKKGLDVYHLS